MKPSSRTTSLARKVKLPKKTRMSEFKAGLTVEKEHRDVTKGSKVKTAKIAKAHLKELPDYYTRLKRMEKKNG